MKGIYLNKGNEDFRSSKRAEYVDKSGIISVINSTIDTNFRCSCTTRCRRFGKSMVANMLCAYYDRSCDSRELFADLEIAKDSTFEEYLNKYPVIKIDMTDFTTRFDASHIMNKLNQEVINEVLREYPDFICQSEEDDDLMAVLSRIALQTGDKFIMVIDEWDAICREAKMSDAVDKYVNWLRRLFKGSATSDVFAAVYMTGILPIKKYKTESALNNFIEYSMVSPGDMAPYFGFTMDEVQHLCRKYDFNVEEMKKWYDGYQIGNQPSMFNPNSVMQALRKKECLNFWSATGAYEAVAQYIDMNYNGLKDDIINLLCGGRALVDVDDFQNDLRTIDNKDNVLTVLIHLGYLSYDSKRHECYIPNLEVGEEMTRAVKSNRWKYVSEALTQSEQLLRATLSGDNEAVAKAIDKIHSKETSILSYNNENSMACVLTIAYYSANNDYIIQRELASGKGFADLVFIPRKNVEKPAIIMELKYDKDADSAIDQIHRKDYPSKVAEYTGELLLVGINYDKTSKSHTCKIETWHK